MMDESANYSDVEVFWDCDSPTPSAWRKLQEGPTRPEEVYGSPILMKSKRRVPGIPQINAGDRPRFEESRKEINQIINALRRASRDDAKLEQSNAMSKLKIPDLPDQEEESEEERTATVPVFTGSSNLPNTSMDLLFDMSGNGEYLAPTASEKLHPSKNMPLPLSDELWTDDDMFGDEDLISAVDRLPKVTPVKIKDFPQKASTPLQREKPAKRNETQNGDLHGKRKAHGVEGNRYESSQPNSSAKGFLDFFMDKGKPPKPSPTKVNGLSSEIHENKYKFSKPSANSKINTGRVNIENKRECPQVQTAVNCKKTALTFVSNYSLKLKIKQTSVKTADTSIPRDILDELIMEDSWTDEEVPPAEYNKGDTKANPTSQCKMSSMKELNQNMKCENSLKKAQDLQKPKHPALSRSHTMHTTSTFTTNTNTHKPQKPSPCSLPANTSDCFSDDDDFLLDAVALVESQNSTKNSAALHEIKNKIPIPCPTLSTSKCSASEIERKKQIAMERRMQRMRTEKSSRH